MAASVAGPRVGWVLGWDPVATAPGSDSAHADARAVTVAGTWVEWGVGWDPVATRECVRTRRANNEIGIALTTEPRA